MEDEQIAKKEIDRVLDKPTDTDIEFSENQRAIAQLIRMSQKKVKHIISVCEANGNKPELIYRDAMDLNYELNTIATDLEENAKISE